MLYILTFFFPIEQPGGRLQSSPVFEGRTLGKLGMVCSTLRSCPVFFFTFHGNMFLSLLSFLIQVE